MAEAGYSVNPLATKLGIKPGHRIGLFGAPAGFDDVLAATLPAGVVVRRRASGPLDVILSFHTQRTELERRLATLSAAIDVDGGLWIAWPKRASGMATDLTDNVVREVALPTGLVDVKVCAIDPTWSGLRLCWRKELRAARR